MENVCIFYDHLEYFTAIWYILWTFGMICGHLVYFSRFGMFGPRKIWQPWLVKLFAKLWEKRGKKRIAKLLSKCAPLLALFYDGKGTAKKESSLLKIHFFRQTVFNAADGRLLYSIVIVSIFRATLLSINSFKYQLS
jgi:hypothetical protein